MCGTLRHWLRATETQQLAREVHQTWLTPLAVANRSSSELQPPRLLTPMIARWRHALPRWTYRLWTTVDNRALWEVGASEHLHVYDGYRTSVQRADASRLLYMHVRGGVYADLDVTPCDSIANRLDWLRNETRLLLVRSPSRGNGSSGYVANHFTASLRGHPFWWFALSRLKYAVNTSLSMDVMRSTGPYWFNSMWNYYMRHAHEGGCLGDLLNTTKVIHFSDYQAHIAGHHWAGTWHSDSGDPRNVDRLQAWLGHNRSATCPEGQFKELINQWDRPFVRRATTTRLRN